MQTLSGTGVAACQVSTYYYVSFAYLMMRRYQDAIRTLSSILVYIQRTKQYHQRSYQFDEVMAGLFSVSAGYHAFLFFVCVAGARTSVLA